LGWEKFVKLGGEQLRYNYKLNKESVLFDLGGYDGQFASDFYSQHLCYIYVFEAYGLYASAISDRFKNNPKIKVYNFGLSGKDSEIEMSIDSVASSVFKKSENMVKAHLRDATVFFDTEKISKIDLMKINIEGGEYELLDHLINSDKINMIENLQIQFHDFVPNATEKMLDLRKRLAQTHNPTYLCDFIWENWTRTI
jgi:FkbM family methyltransferase